MLGPRTLLGSVISSLWVMGWGTVGITISGAIAALPLARSPLPSQRSVARAPVRPTFTAIPRLSGFSADGHHYIYLESARDTGAGIPKAWLQMVNVAANRCLPDVCVETHYGENTASWSLARAELEMLRQIWQMRQTLGLATPQAGASLQILSRSRDATGTEILTFRLPNQPQPAELRLFQKRVGMAAAPQIDVARVRLELRHPGRSPITTVIQRFPEPELDGSRCEIAIREIKLSPGRDRLVILLTVTQPTFEGTLALTLVQGFSLETDSSPTIP
jgi:predicted secreted protein